VAAVDFIGRACRPTGLQVGGLSMRLGGKENASAAFDRVWRRVFSPGGHLAVALFFHQRVAR